jgi:hypothetical protein
MQPREYVQLVVLAVLVTSALLGVLMMLFRKRRSPQERERLRRLAVNERGRLADGYIFEATETTVFYSYTVRGVEYTTSQDVSTIREMISGATERLIGPVTLKYLTVNPANSIIACERWSGLRSTVPPHAAGEVDQRAG